MSCGPEAGDASHSQEICPRGCVWKVAAGLRCNPSVGQGSCSWSRRNMVGHLAHTFERPEAGKGDPSAPARLDSWLVDLRPVVHTISHTPLSSLEGERHSGLHPACQQRHRDCACLLRAHLCHRVHRRHVSIPYEGRGSGHGLGGEATALLKSAGPDARLRHVQRSPWGASHCHGHVQSLVLCPLPPWGSLWSGEEPRSRAVMHGHS